VLSNCVLLSAPMESLKWSRILPEAQGVAAAASISGK
jgi:hypothetical protein